MPRACRLPLPATIARIAWRLRRGWALCLLVLAPVGMGAAAAPCTLTAIASLPAVTLADKRMLAPVVINDKRALMLIDTGSADSSSLFPWAVTALGLSPARIRDRFVTADGSGINRAVYADSVIAGALTLHDQRFLLWPAIPIETPTPAGLLGPDILRRYDLELDPAHGQVRLFAQDHCPGAVVYWADRFTAAPLRVARSGHLYAAMTLDGERLEAMIDTGSSETYLSLRTARHLFDLDPDSPGMVPTTEAGLPAKLHLYRHPFGSLTLAGIAVSHPEITIIEDRVATPPDIGRFGNPGELPDEPMRLPDLTLGMNVLSRLHLYVAYGEKRLYATAAGAK